MEFLYYHISKIGGTLDIEQKHIDRWVSQICSSEDFFPTWEQTILVVFAPIVATDVSTNE